MTTQESSRLRKDQAPGTNVSYQMSLDFGKIIPLMDHEDRMKAIRLTGTNFESGVIFTVRKLTPTPDLYLETIKSSIMMQLHHMRRTDVEINSWTERMYAHGFAIFGTKWVDFISEEIAKRNDSFTQRRSINLTA